jgi:energy-coupling factor transport system permease protein
MFKDITIGQYFPADTVIHRLDPRTKILWTIAFIVSVFIAADFLGLAVCAVFVLIIILLSKVPPLRIIKGLRMVFVILLITFILNIFTYDGEVLLRIWRLTITDTGLYNGTFLFCRISLLVLGASLLTFCTKPTDLTSGIESLLSPLKPLRFPAHETAMIMSIALRFIPILLIELDRIIKAQTSRGANFSRGNLLKRGKALLAIFIPLLVRSFSIADSLALAMEARCYAGGDGRSKYHPLRFTRTDFAAFGLMLLLPAALILMRLLQ